MCVAPTKPKAPAGDPNVEIERENQKQEELKNQAQARAETLQRTIKRKRGGLGSVSLLTGSKGGMGYFDGTL